MSTKLHQMMTITSIVIIIIRVEKKIFKIYKNKILGFIFTSICFMFQIFNQFFWSNRIDKIEFRIQKWFFFCFKSWKSRKQTKEKNVMEWIFLGACFCFWSEISVFFQFENWDYENAFWLSFVFRVNKCQMHFENLYFLFFYPSVSMILFLGFLQMESEWNEWKNSKYRYICVDEWIEWWTEEKHFRSGFCFVFFSSLEIENVTWVNIEWERKWKFSFHQICFFVFCFSIWQFSYFLCLPIDLIDSIDSIFEFLV